MLKWSSSPEWRWGMAVAPKRCCEPRIDREEGPQVKEREKNATIRNDGGPSGYPYRVRPTRTGKCGPAKTGLPVAWRLQVGHDRHQGGKTDGSGTGSGPALHTFRLFGTRRFSGPFRR